MESKEAFDELSTRLDKSLEEYNHSAAKKVMVIPKPNGEKFYIFNRKTVVVSSKAGNQDSIVLEYYKGQKDVMGHAFETAAEFVEKEELKCFLKEGPYFSFSTLADKMDTDHMVKALLSRIFRGCIPSA
jgi:hypothetical protein